MSTTEQKKPPSKLWTGLVGSLRRGFYYTDPRVDDLNEWLEEEKRGKEKTYRQKRKLMRPRIEVIKAIGEIVEPNWERVLLDLRRARVPSAYIAEAVGMHESTLAVWLKNSKNGATKRRMGWKMGVALLRLHDKYCKEIMNDQKDLHRGNGNDTGR